MNVDSLRRDTRPAKAETVRQGNFEASKERSFYRNLNSTKKCRQILPQQRKYPQTACNINVKENHLLPNEFPKSFNSYINGNLRDRKAFKICGLNCREHIKK